jgi:hypothetical protein
MANKLTVEELKASFPVTTPSILIRIEECDNTTYNGSLLTIGQKTWNWKPANAKKGKDQVKEKTIAEIIDFFNS